MKENQIILVKEFRPFSYMERCKNRGSLKSFLWYELHISGARILYFYILLFPHGSPSMVAATVDNWQCLFTDTAGSIPILSINQKLQSLIIQNE